MEQRKSVFDFIKNYWKQILLCLVFMIVGIYEYYKFVNLEQNGGSVKVYAAEKMLYELFGVWGNLIGLWLLAFGFLAFCIYQYRKPETINNESE